jgi:hypothetical protein
VSEMSTRRVGRDAGSNRDSSLMKTHIHKNERLRAELARLRARYDCHTVSPAIYAVIRELETEIGWAKHQEQERSR